jgi:hypothetical protein
MEKEGGTLTLASKEEEGFFSTFLSRYRNRNSSGKFKKSL